MSPVFPTAVDAANRVGATDPFGVYHAPDPQGGTELTHGPHTFEDD